MCFAHMGLAHAENGPLLNSGGVLESDQFRFLTNVDAGWWRTQESTYAVQWLL